MAQLKYVFIQYDIVGIDINHEIYVLDELELAEENNTDDSSHDVETRHILREQDRFLPIANVAKIMKKAIPESGKVHLCHIKHIFH